MSLLYIVNLPSLSFLESFLIVTKGSFRIQGGSLVERRHFVLGIVPLLAALVGCFRETVTFPEIGKGNSTNGLKSSLVLPGSIAAFLESRGLVIYADNTEWEFPQGIFSGLLFMTQFQSYGEGGYEVYVDGQYILSAINLTSFDPRRQRMRIERHQQVVWHYRPRRRPDVHLREALSDDARR